MPKAIPSRYFVLPRTNGGVDVFTTYVGFDDLTAVQKWLNAPFNSGSFTGEIVEIDETTYKAHAASVSRKYRPAWRYDKQAKAFSLDPPTVAAIDARPVVKTVEEKLADLEAKVSALETKTATVK